MVTEGKYVLSRGMLDIIIESLMEERLFNIAHRKTQENTEYDKWRRESFLLSEDIKNTMGPRQSIFRQYEELSALCESALLQNGYKQGFMDGIKLLQDMLSLKMQTD